MSCLPHGSGLRLLHGAVPCRPRPNPAASLQQHWHRSVAAPTAPTAQQAVCSACSRKHQKRAKHDHALRAVQGTQLPGELRGSNAEDNLEALPPPVQPFAVVLGAGPTGAFMVSIRRLGNARRSPPALRTSLSLRNTSELPLLSRLLHACPMSSICPQLRQASAYWSKAPWHAAPVLLTMSQTASALQALLLAQQGWQVNVYDSRPRLDSAWDAHSMAHAQNVVLGRRAQLCLARADALQQVPYLLGMRPSACSLVQHCLVMVPPPA